MAETRQPVRFNARAAYIFSDLPSYVRAKKTLPVLASLFHEVHFIGCRRRRSWDAGRPEGIHYHIDPRELGYGLGTIGGVLRFIGTIRRVLREVRPEVVIAVNEEYILPFTFGMLPRPRTLVLDLYDSIGMRITGPARRLNPLWRKLSETAMRTADGLVEVNEERLAWHRVVPRATAVVHNAPPWIETITPMEGLPEPFLYVSGSLEDDLHGAEALLAALEKVPGMNIVFTGRALGPFVTGTFLKHPRVHNLGMIPYEDVLRVLAAARGLYNHTSPVRLNYIYGAPNKLYEAMMTGRPLLINRENHAARLAEKHGFGLVAPYGDVEEIAAQLRLLRDGAGELSAACVRAREAFREEYAWDRWAAVRWSELFLSLGVPVAEPAGA